MTRRAQAWLAVLAATWLLHPAAASARQESTTGNDRVPGSAVVTVDGAEYLIRIECRARGRPEAGFSTEPNRVTREETGVVSLEFAMSAASDVRDGIPVATTNDMWQSGDRPPGPDGVRIAASCRTRDPAAPAFRRVGG